MHELIIYVELEKISSNENQLMKI